MQKYHSVHLFFFSKAAGNYNILLRKGNQNKTELKSKATLYVTFYEWAL